MHSSCPKKKWDQKQKTAFQIFHFICKDKHRKIDFFFFPIRLTYVCLCFSILPHIYMKSLCWLFFLASHRFSPMLGNSQETCSQYYHPHLHHTGMVASECFLVVSELSRKRNSSFKQPPDDPHSTQVSPGALESMHGSAQRQPCHGHFSLWECRVSHSRWYSVLLASSQDCGFQW